MTADGAALDSDKVIPAQGYAGDVTPRLAWSILQNDSDAVLVDVRTTAEWSYVGFPDLGTLGKQPVFLEWQIFPSMQVNADFAAALRKAGIDGARQVVLLCRSGVRSKAAAMALTKTGMTRCYNIIDGFEGPLDGTGHRGRLGGWKAAGLPWVQK